MKNIFIRSVRDEVISFFDRKAKDLSKVAGRKVTRNEYIGLVLEKHLRDDLALDDRLDCIDEKIDLLVEVITEEREANNRIIGLVVHGDDISEGGVF